MKRRGKIIAAVAALAIAAGAAAAFLQRATAPEVRFATLGGEKLSTSDLRGKVVLVNFWATSCVTCVKEMPMLVETHRRYAPRGYETLAVAMSYDHPNQVAEFARNRALPFKIALDTTGEIAKRFDEVRVTPEADDNRDGKLDQHEFLKAESLHDRIVTGKYVDDSVITAKVRAALLKEPQLKSLDVSVETYKGEVLLSGFVRDEEQRRKAMQVAIAVNGVASVKDAMLIR